MTREWKPGDVALVRCGPDYVIALWSGDDCQPRAVGQDHPAEPHWHTQSARYIAHDSRDVHPLVVLDPEDREQVARLAAAWDAQTHARLDEGAPMTLSGWRMQAALRSLIEPPKPDEPTGLGAVVEDRWGHTLVRANDDDEPWWNVGEEQFCNWSHVAAVRVLSGGVQP